MHKNLLGRIFRESFTKELLGSYARQLQKQLTFQHWHSQCRISALVIDWNFRIRDVLQKPLSEADVILWALAFSIICFSLIISLTKFFRLFIRYGFNGTKPKKCRTLNVNDAKCFEASISILQEVFVYTIERSPPRLWLKISQFFISKEKAGIESWKTLLASNSGHFSINILTRRLAVLYLLNPKLVHGKFNPYILSIITASERMTDHPAEIRKIFRGNAPLSKFLTQKSSFKFHVMLLLKSCLKYEAFGTDTEKAIIRARLYSVILKQKGHGAEKNMEEVEVRIKKAFTRHIVHHHGMIEEIKTKPISFNAIRCIYYQNYKCLDDKLC